MKKIALLLFVLLSPISLFAQKTFNVVNYGAVADSVTSNTLAFQKTIDACSAAGGGTVWVPAGKYLMGTVRLRSNINLHLDAGAVLLGSTRLKDYPGIGMATEQRDNALVLAIDASNVSITGRGTIDGNGRKFIDRQKQKGLDFDRDLTRQGQNFIPGNAAFVDGPYSMLDRPGVLILMINCKNVQLSDFSILDAPNWCLHLGGCSYVNITGLSILNSLFIPNADGIDASNCQYVSISNCSIIAGDDGIAISPCADGYCSKPSENYTVSNCNIVSRSSGIRVGEGVNDIRNLLFQNITITNSNRGIGVYARGRQNVEHVIFSNMIIKTHLLNGVWWGNGDPIQVSALPMTASDTSLGHIRDISFHDIQAQGENGITVYGFKPGHISGISFTNLRLDMKAGPMTPVSGGNFDFRPAFKKELAIFKHDIAGLYLQNAADVSVRDFHLTRDRNLPAFFKDGIHIEQSRGIHLSDLDLGPWLESQESRRVSIDKLSMSGVFTK